MVRVRLVSFGLVLGVAFLLIVSLVLDTAIQAAGMWLFGNLPFVIVGDIVQLMVGLLILSAAFGALMKFLPEAPVEWRDAMVGGVVSTLLFSAGKKLFAFYLMHAGTASAFGAAGSLAVLLMWLYFSAAVLLFSAEFSAARARLHDPRGAWACRTMAACRRATAPRSVRCSPHRRVPRHPRRPRRSPRRPSRRSPPPAPVATHP